MYTALCEDLTEMGHQVTVITAYPHYGRNAASKRRIGKLIEKENFHDMKVIRLYVPVPSRGNLRERLITLGFFNLLSGLAVAFSGPYDVALFTNPTLETGLPVFLYECLKKVPFIYRVHDIYPDILVRLGIIRNRWAISFLQRMEDFCYHRAACIVVVTQGFREHLLRNGIASEKIKVISDWEDTASIKPLPRLNRFREENALGDRFVVMYGGNVGLSQGLETMLECANILAGQEDILFVIVGEGANKLKLQKISDDMGLKNIKFFALQPDEELPFVYAAADVSLVLLKRNISPEWVPAKTYTIMASGRPVIASVDQGGGTWNLIQQAACGLCIEPENPQALVDAILRLYGDEGYRAQLGANGRAYVVQHHSRMSAAREFHYLLCSLVPGGKTSPKERILHG
jgi:colanic acid biosynthesis glycosyl transferase WcaI